MNPITDQQIYDMKGHLQLIMKIAVPIIIQGMVFHLQTIVEKVFLGNLDINYLSAVGVAGFPFNTTVNALTAFCTGLTIIVAQKYGAGKVKDIGVCVNTAIAYNSLISILLFAAWFIFPNTIFKIMRVDSDILPYCNDYVRFLSLSFILFGVDVSLQAALQGMGKTKPIMYAGLMKVLLNIGLGWIMIFGKYGFPAMGVKGAALATTISNFIGCYVLIIYFAYSKMLSSYFSLKEILHFRLNKCKEIIRLGLPTGTEYFIWNVSNLMLLSLLNQQTVIVIAIFTITFAIEFVVYTIFNGIARSTLTLVGYLIGRNNEEGAKKLMTSSIRYSLIVVTVFCIIFILTPESILMIFTKDKTIIHTAAFYLMVRALTMYPKCLNVVVGSGIRAIGDVKWMLNTQIIGSVFVILFSYTMTHGFRTDVFIIYLTLFMDELLRATLNTIRFYRGNEFLQLLHPSREGYSRKLPPRE